MMFLHINSYIPYFTGHVNSVFVTSERVSEELLEL